ncbi:PREDICTED: late blight resistance protein R1-A-like [Nicotiana attenuata]|uniref:late blight resistance protein R1-A-like n=1 Tax=Nicotiana attenuata TaxID=49451 RepID=UPI000905D04C|nr:PREDICTED: late blight resistance protein R1-A-like [Nicotiana attenuata]XP_019237054.1 PREDICTED: late blight resistance protein R1-A-like [Nicotiana attenuata]XP_019237055.1 PREDICTED: late blight resistance protein R1-A-like [Nicotiana attenuata]
MFCKEATEALELMKDQWRLSLTDAILDDINFLIMELKFLDIFLRLQSFTTDSNLLDVSEHVRAMVSVVGSDLKSLFSAGMVSPDQKFDLTLSEVQEKIRICKSEIKAQYSYPQVVNLSDATPTSIAKLIGDVIETIKYVVSTPLTSSLSISPQLQDQLFCSLGSPLTLCYMLALQDSSQMTFFTHAIAVTCHAAMIIFLHFPEHNKETDINSLLTDFLLKRIFPIQPCVRRIYVEVLQSFMSGPQLTWRHAVLAEMETMFTLFLKFNLLMLQLSYKYGLIVPLEDQNQMDYFSEMLDYLGTYLEGLPPQGFGSKLREINNLMVNAALFIFSLYGNEEDVASGEVNQEAALDLPGLIQRISALTYQIIQMSFQSILPRIDGLGFVDFLLVNMKEFLNQSADTLPSAKSQLEAVLKGLEFLHPFLRDVAPEKCINHDRLQHLATVVIGKAYEVEYIVDCFMTKDVPGWYLTPWLSDLIVEIEFLKAEVEKIKEDKVCDALTDNFTNASNVATSSQSASMPSTAE